MLAIGLLLGGGAIGAYQVMAQNNTAVNAPAAIQPVDTQNVSTGTDSTVENENDLSDDTDMNENESGGQDDQAESQALAGSAKITVDQAKQAAEAAVGGTAISAQLENENGTLDYEVKIGNQEVNVNANNGSIMKTGQGDNNEAGSGTENETGSDNGTEAED